MAFPQDQVSWLAANRDKIGRYMFIPQLLAAALFFGFAYYTGQERVGLVIHGAHAEGRIVSFRTVRFEHTSGDSRLRHTDYIYLPTVEFTGAGRLVRFEEWMGMRTDSGVGMLVPLLYDPNNPTLAMIDRGYLNFFPWAVCFLIGLPVFLAAFKGFFGFVLSSRRPNTVALHTNSR